MEILKPYKLNKGDTIGIFTPSSPAYRANEELFLNGVKNIEALGFKVKLGSLTAKRASQGYRSGTPKERAQEFMELIKDDEVKCLISTIGGMNSNSIIPYLDFDLIREKRKIICGYSDVSSLHLS
ncbi:LD-carboxypeptidase, partial [Flavobacterium alkalisoli]|uniref:LD-carboxypeptidase n=1 Tax=Flavobacterium alkalisoli TaxID=2602769 RepID=UPI003A8CBCCA